MKKFLLPLALATVALLTSSCGPTPQALTSTPPAKALKVTEFTWGDGILLKKYTFPTAVYQPEGEDKGGFYYYPQNAQVKVSDTGMHYGAKGGIYWKKDLPQPGHIFVTTWAGSPNLSKKDIPAVPVR